MSIGFKGLIIIFFGMTLILCMRDLLGVSKMMDDNFSTIRTANENALNYLDGETEITDIEMLNNWLYCFAEDNNMTFEELKIKFISLGSNPPYYVVRIEGSNSYAIISEEVHSAFKNSAAIVLEEIK